MGSDEPVRGVDPEYEEDGKAILMKKMKLKN